MPSGDVRYIALLVLLVALCANVACYSPSLTGCNIRCGDGTSCPDDFTCQAGLCRPNVGECVSSRRFHQISTGDKHACAIDMENNLFCWGSDEYGQVTGSTDDTSPPAVPVATALQVSGVTGWQSVDAGSRHTCAIGIKTDSSAKVYCWGNNELGQGGQTSRRRMAPIELESLAGIPAAIYAGAAHTCVRTSDGQLFCFGNNDDGQLGNATMTASTTPVLVSGAQGWTDATAGSNFTCGVRDGVPLCWGENNRSQTGRGTQTASETAPGPVAGGVFDSTNAAVSISAGFDSACIVHVENTVRTLRCWGDNFDGEAGQTSATMRVAQANTVDGLAGPWQDVRVGGNFACGLRDGQIHCWGLDDERLGDGVSQPRAAFGPLADFEVSGATTNDAFAFDLGDEFGCALFGKRSTGGVPRCWGANDYGQLGNGRHTRVHMARRSPVAGPWDVVRLGTAFGCGIKRGGMPSENTVWCWGDNTSAQVSDAMFNVPYFPTPVEVTYARGAIDLAVGNDHACALVKTTGVDAVRCWGSNAAVELGTAILNATMNEPPLEVGNPWSAITAGGDLTCVATSESPPELHCWGTSAWLTTIPPVEQTPFQNHVNVRLGTDSACGIVNDMFRVMRCMGSDFDGERGDRTQTEAQTDVVDFNGSSIVDFIDLSETYFHHRCGTRPDNIMCWGKNDLHQVIAGTMANQTFAQPIPLIAIMPASPRDRVIATGLRFTCTIAAPDGRVMCWGDNTYQQCTAAGSGNVGKPTAIDVESGATTFRSIAAGETTACAIGADDQLYCWGACNRGQCATGDSSQDELVTVNTP